MNKIARGKALLLWLQFDVWLKGVSVKQVRLEAVNISRRCWMAVVGGQGRSQLERGVWCLKIVGLAVKIGSHPARSRDEIRDFGLSEM